MEKYEYVRKNGEIVARPSQEWVEYQQTQRTRILLSRSKLPESTLDRDFDSYVGDCDHISKLRVYVDRFREKFRSIHLYLWSHQNSTQKTTMACVTGKHLLQKGYDVRFILMNDLTRILLEQDFKDDAAAEVTKLLNHDFLIIDDAFDKNKVTIYKSGYQLAFLDGFLRNRLEVHRRATCFTSNLAISEIGEVFGQHIQALLNRNVIDPMEFYDSISLRNEFNPDDLWR